MDADLEPVYYKITQATRPEEVFGEVEGTFPPETIRKHVDRAFDQLRQITKPIHGYSHPNDADLAANANEELDRFRAEADALIDKGIYGIERLQCSDPPRSKSFTAGFNTYGIGSKLTETGRISTYEGVLIRQNRNIGSVTIKLADAERFNQFLHNEIHILNRLHDVSVPQWRHLPFVLDKFRAGTRAGIVFRKIAGVSLHDVRRDSHHRGGVIPQHMVWMLDRILSCLGYVHLRGVVHGTIDPTSILIRPSNHNAFVVNWDSAVREPAVTGQTVSYETPTDFLAPEVNAGQEVGPWTDIYSLGKTMIWVLGGEPGTNELPAGVPVQIQDFLFRMVEPCSRARPADAWQLYEEQNELKDSLWERKFLRFPLTR